MSTLVINGHVYCKGCSAPIPEGWLGCPECAGFVKVKGNWIPPSRLQPKAQHQQDQPNSTAAAEQTSLFNLTEYLA